LSRLAEDPLIRVHRKASEDFLDLYSLRLDLRPLDQELLPHGECGTGTRSQR
jgi:hypothetical protein